MNTAAKVMRALAAYTAVPPDMMTKGESQPKLLLILKARRYFKSARVSCFFKRHRDALRRFYRSTKDSRWMCLGVEDVLREIHLVVWRLNEVQILESLGQEEGLHTILRLGLDVVHVRV